MSEPKAVRWEQATLGFLVGLACLSELVLAWQATTPRPVGGAGTVIERLCVSATSLEASGGACELEEEEPEGAERSGMCGSAIVRPASPIIPRYTCSGSIPSLTFIPAYQPLRC